MGDLNMLLLDETKWRKEGKCAFSSYPRQWTFCAGNTDRKHPEWLASPFRQEVLRRDEGSRSEEIRTLDHEGVQALRNHAKRLFQVMYRSSSLSVDEIVYWLESRYDLHRQISKS